jgi:hypothetical protein
MPRCSRKVRGRTIPEVFPDLRPASSCLFDSAVRVEVAQPEDPLHMRPMTRRPERFVRKPRNNSVSTPAHRARRGGAVLEIGGWHVQPVPSIDDCAIDGSGAVCHPYSGAGLHERFQRVTSPLADRATFDGASGRPARAERLTIGEHDDPIAAVDRVHVSPQALCRPHGTRASWSRPQQPAASRVSDE